MTKAGIVMSLFQNKSILYVEDDISSRTRMAELLEMLFENVYTAKDGEEAWSIYTQNECDIVLTDIKMPSKDGLSLTKQIRNCDYATPIVLLSSFTDHDFLLKAANLSVDGYIIKPIDADTLLKTLGKAFERTKKEENLILKIDTDIFYNVSSRELYQKDGTLIDLSAMELKLLELLVDNSDHLVTKDKISETLWPLEQPSESSIKNIILRLRKKVGEEAIHSVYGIGYRLKNRPQKIKTS